MSAPFRINGSMFGSPRFEVLGQVAGYNALEALGRWARAGSECTERQGYVLSEPLVVALFGPRGVEALLAAELAEPTESGLRMLEMDGDIEWYGDIASKRRRAGQARAANAQRDDRGRLLPSSKPSTAPARAGVLDQHPTSTAPAQSSSLAPVPDPVLPEQGEPLDLKPPGRERSRRKPATPLPGAWNPSAEDNRRSGLSEQQLDHELAKFRDYAKANDWRKQDWDATWRNWLRKAEEIAPHSRRPPLPARQPEPRIHHEEL